MVFNLHKVWLILSYLYLSFGYIVNTTFLRVCYFLPQDSRGRFIYNICFSNLPSICLILFGVYWSVFYLNLILNNSFPTFPIIKCGFWQLLSILLKYSTGALEEQCPASSELLTPHPLSIQRVCPRPAPKAGGTHSPGDEGVGSHYFGRHWIGLLQYNPSTLRTNLSSSCMINLFTVYSTSNRAIKGRVPRCFAVVCMVWVLTSPVPTPANKHGWNERKTKTFMKILSKFSREVTNADFSVNWKKAKLVSNIGKRTIFA